jgi:hypothetical protein
MINIEEIVFLVNFLTEDIADITMEYCKHDCSGEEVLNQTLEELGLSIPKIAYNTASMVHHNKQLNIQFFNNMNLFRVSILEYLDRDKFFELIGFFKEPKKIKIIDLSPQIGGIIDKNYGIKFKIKVL